MSLNCKLANQSLIDTQALIKAKTRNGSPTYLCITIAPIKDIKHIIIIIFPAVLKPFKNLIIILLSVVHNIHILQLFLELRIIISYQHVSNVCCNNCFYINYRLFYFAIRRLSILLLLSFLIL